MPLTDAEAIARLYTMSTFIPLPSDPKQLTPEHARLAFAGGDIDGVLRESLRLIMEKRAQQTHPTTQPDADDDARESA